ncbi:MAG: 23S rRNA (pseudouridine(1915)-N(3))-methyltransferase RlmH [Tannerella sp.]|jgi:23S rRNA (pseudouridine1915-N3)-methyltransferase|nr:23S rRNA (pseudouridine(1915)-N(3))-methyltransferase RlmH [Tannerella sp.]
MKIVLLVVGKTDAGYWNEALDDYTKRLRHYAPFGIEVVPDIKNSRGMTEQQQKEQEGASILNVLQAGDSCVLLDERGKEYSSCEFASFLEKKALSGVKRLVFVVGGPYGFGENVRSEVNECISLSRMTFSHQMIRPVFVEQLYRAMTILRGEKYHHY